MFGTLRRYLIAGLLVWAPLGATVLVVTWLVGLMDRTLLLLPAAARPEALIGFSIPGLGVLLALAVLLLTGALVANFIGHRLVGAWESLLSRIPLVRSIYSAVKQLIETVFSSTGQSFRKVVLVQFPHQGAWTVAFLTGTAAGEVQRKTSVDLVNVYVPTTPNPTGGYFLMFPRDQVIELEMSVDEGLKMIISMGAIVPGAARPAGKQVPSTEALAVPSRAPTGP